MWEITGAEFTKHEVHTASGISVRFPRVTRIRSDKSWETATSLPELKVTIPSLFVKYNFLSKGILMAKIRNQSYLLNTYSSPISRIVLSVTDLFSFN